jgi:hypothetical protein
MKTSILIIILFIAVAVVMVLNGCMNVKTNTVVTEQFDKNGQVTKKITETKSTDDSFTLGTKGGNGEVNIIPLTVSGIN